MLIVPFLAEVLPQEGNELIQLFAQSDIKLNTFCRELARRGVDKCDRRNASFNSIFIFPLSKTDASLSLRTVFPSNDDDVLVRLVDESRYVRPCILAGGWKIFHATWNAIQFQQCLDDLQTLVPQIFECRANEDLIALVH